MMNLSPQPARSAMEELERYGRLLLRHALGRMGLAFDGRECETQAALLQRLGVVPGHARLAEALLLMLERAGWLQRDGDLLCLQQVALDSLPQPAAESRRLRLQLPALTACLDLLEAALEAYPAVLSGRRRAVEVLFPDGSQHLVEPIYQNDDVSAYYNGQCAQLVKAYVAGRHRLDRQAVIRILEVGAGTGSTSAAVLAALDGQAGAIDYLYTDLSSGFFETVAQSLGQGRPWLRFQRLDVSRDLSLQGIAEDSIDLVLGTNVLHAVAQIDATLNRLKAVMRRHGVLLISEATAVREFSTLTFGLTEGWWLFEDPQYRLPGSPLLGADAWLAALARCGFQGGSARRRVGSDDGWHLILGESDGIRQRVAATSAPRAAVAQAIGTPSDTAVEPVQDWLRSVFSEVLKLPPQRLDVYATLDTYGVDSLLVMKITRRLAEPLGRLPASLLFENNTIASLAQWVASHRAQAVPLAATVVQSVVRPVPEPVPGSVSESVFESVSEALPEMAATDAIAIVGLSGRYPGAETLAQFWQQLRDGHCAVTEVPVERWDWRADAEAGAGTRWGGFLSEVDCFDPLFFRIAPSEAAAMDPQERLFIESAWWALEDAGYTRATLAARLGGAVGVFAGVMNHGYEWLGASAAAKGIANGAHTAHWSVANRISYLFDLNGPSMAVDTACSSSLAAIHLACESLRRGECRMALAGGVNLILHQDQLRRLDRLGMLAADGRCKSFGAGADGMVDGEGVGVVVLRPLQQAQRDGDRILGVIRASAINAGGRTAGYTVPNPKAQAAVVQAALQRAGLTPDAINYVETHGTGTGLGDPIEIAGLAAAWQGYAGHCAIGSVKSNIGHLESAAGIAGLTKLLLQLQHRTLAPSLHADVLNPGILFDDTPFALQRAAAAWQPVAPGAPLRAGLSSFGAGGVNAHLVLEEYRAPAFPATAVSGPQVLLLSARDEERLRVAAGRLSQFLDSADGRTLALADIAWTLRTGREAMEARAAFEAGSVADAARMLAQFAAGAASAPYDGEVGRWLLGTNVAWADLPAAGRRVGLPGYPFARKRYWITALPQPASPGRPLPAATAAQPAMVPADDDGAIAIVGAAGRFPGPGADGVSADGATIDSLGALDALWRVLADGVDAVSEIPAERWRWDQDGFFHADIDAARAAMASYTRWGGFLEGGIDRFDARHFGMAPREADLIDPQERVFLEVAWHALEHAGYRRDRLAGAAGGVYVGAMFAHYQMFEYANGIPVSSFASIANRVSHVLDWRGASMTLDTMCSSSLLAVQLACEALRRGELDIALAGGVNLIVHPYRYALLSQARLASTDGRCRSFGAGGDGYVPGEGAGAVVLKRLAQAVADGDTIWGVIRGGAVNHSGRSSGNAYMVPSQAAQSELVTQALAASGVAPASISYIEGHGTGTAVGDPIEVRALHAALDGAGTDTIALGSVKSNIGHLESAAGIAGLLKLVLQFQQRQLAPVVPHDPAGRLNPHIDFAATRLRVVRQLTPWSNQGGPRRAGLSGFGAGGTNVHLVLEEAPLAPLPATPGGLVLVPLSAPSPGQLRTLAMLLLARLEATPAAYRLADVGFTLQAGREPYDERLAILAADLPDLCRQLRDYVALGQMRFSASLADAEALAEAPAPASMARWRAGLDLDELAQHWIAGGDPHWEELYEAGQRPRRIALPGCPLRRTRHWGREREPQALPTAGTHVLLAPVLPSLNEQRFPLTLQAGAHWLEEHQIQGRAVLPAAAGIEIVLAAASALGERLPLALSGVRWMRPLALGETSGPAGVMLRQGAAAIEFELYQQQHDMPLTSALGQVERVAGLRPAALPLAAIRQRCTRVLAPQACYAALTSAGLDYGASFRSLHSVQAGTGEVLAELRLPAGRQHDAAAFVLHPALLDGAFQAILALSMDAAHGYVPVGAERIEIIAALPPHCLVHIVMTDTSPTVQHVDLTLADAQGEVLLRVSRFALHAFGLPPQVPVWFRPEWQAEELVAGAALDGPLLTVNAAVPVQAALRRLHAGVLLAASSKDVAGAGSSHDAWAEWLAAQVGQLDGAVLHVLIFAQGEPLPLLMDLIQALLRQRPGAAVRLLYVFSGATDLTAAPRDAAVAGFGRSLLLENPHYQLATLTLPAGCDAAASAAWALRELHGTRRADVRYDGTGRRTVMRLAELPAPAAPALVLPTAPVCLITGGAGGVGMQIALHLARRHGARLILAGSSPAGPATAGLLVRLLDAGASAADYICADVSQAQGAAALVAAIRAQHGQLDGVVHSAGVLRDGLLFDKKIEDARAVLGPKLDAAEHLDAAIGAGALSFFVLCSSTSAELGNAGQCDYAYANSALDHFARQREALRAQGRRSGVTRSVNWPFWRDGGMHLAPAVLDWMQSSLGMVPLESATGVHVFERALASDEPQLLVMTGEAARLRRLVALAAGVPQAPAQALAVAPVRSTVTAALTAQVESTVKAVLAEVLLVEVAELRNKDAFERYGVDSISGMQIVRGLERHFGTLPANLLYEEATVGRLIARLAQLRAADESSATGLAPQVAVLAAPAIVAPSAIVTPVPAPVAAPPAGPPPTAADDAIAVIGMAGRYPLAEDTAQLWHNLLAGRDCIGSVPAGRWPDADAEGRWGGFIEVVDQFDARFFQISPRDAEIMDPQTRLLLQTAWHALEDAGQTRARLRDAHAGAAAGVGVFVASMYQHYPYAAGELQMAARLSSSSQWSIANRISHAFDLGGPSMAIDSACSGSLSAIHLACDSLRRGDCVMALAGGVNLSLHGQKYVALAQMGMLSSSPQSRSLGQGDGMVPGEGVGVVLLKPLALALRDGDRVHGVIRASVLNHGGRHGGFTVPNPEAQAALVTRALRQSGVAADSISYIESAANGSALGDPAEIAALTQALRAETAAVGFCALGAVKSNIGHLEAASGVSQLTKVLLQMRHATLAPTLHAQPLHPQIQLDGSPFVVQHQCAPWQAPVDAAGRQLPRRAGICSFGAGGSNAFMLVDEAPPQAATAAGPGDSVFLLSAQDEEGLRRQAQALRRALAQDVPGGWPLADVAYTLQTGREFFEFRLALQAADRAALLAALDAYVSGQGGEGQICGVADDSMAALFTLTQLRQLGASAWDLAALWSKGVQVPWKELFWPAGGRLACLPGYAFRRQRFWLGMPPPGAATTAPEQAPASGAVALEAEVGAMVAALLRMPPEELDPRRDLMEYGFDSLLGMQLINRLADRYGLSLSPLDLFADTTVMALCQRIREVQAPMPAVPMPLAGGADGVPFALSRGQQALLHVEQQAPGHAAHNLPCAFRIGAPFDAALLEQALRQTVARHDGLRLRLRRQGDGFVQYVDEAAIPLLQMLTAPPGLQQAARSAYLTALGRRAFDLLHELPVRAHLVEFAPDDCALLLSFHHIAFDGLSLAVFLGDLTHSYDALRQGRALVLPVPAARYADFVRWQEQHLASPAGVAGRRYWQQRLGGRLPLLELPLDRPRPAVPGYHGAVCTGAVDAGRTEALKQLARHSRLNLYALMCGAFLALLHRATGATDLLIGAPLSGRPETRFERVIGYFANMSLLRLDCDPAASFGTLARQVHHAMLDAMAHADIPYSDVAQALAATPGDPVAPPLVRLVFGFQNWMTSLDSNIAEDLAAPAAAADARLMLSTIEEVHQSGEFDLALTVVESEGRCMLFFKYDAELFDHATMVRMHADYAGLLDGVLRQGMDCALSALLDLPLAVNHQQADAAAPLSFSQERLWFLHQMEPEVSRYNVPMVLTLDGVLEVDVLHAAFGRVVARHAALRTRFGLLDGVPVQLLDGGSQPALPLWDLSTLPAAAAEAAAQDLVIAQTRQRFDLENGPLLRLGLICLAAQRHVLIVCAHHIIVDGWSLGLLLTELSAGYADVLAGRPVTGSAPALRYVDYARQQRAWMATVARSQAEAYWRAQLHDAPARLRLPADHARPLRSSGRGGSIALRLAASTGERLRLLARQERVTPFMLLATACGVLLHRWCGADDFCIGMPVAGRERAELRDMIGYFVNTLALRMRVSQQPTSLRSLLGEVKATVSAALAHQTLPLERVIEVINPERVPGVNPLFQVMVSYENNQRSPVQLGQATLDRFAFPWEESKFDLTFDFIETGVQLEAWIEYDADLFEAASIELLAQRLNLVLEAMLTDLTLAVGELPLLLAGEEERLLNGASATAVAPLAGLLERLAARALAQPEQCAIDGPDGVWSTAALQQRAACVAAALLASGLTPQAPVGLLLERSADAVAAMLGIWMAGGVYLPLEPDAPSERLAYVLGDAGASHVLSRTGLAGRLPEAGFSGPVIALDQPLPLAMTAPVARAPGQAAYMIYTSGSTGQPKGVVVTDANLAHLCSAVTARYGLRESDRVLHFAALSFDVAIEEIFPTLWAGATLVPYPPQALLEAAALTGFVAHHAVSVLNLPTAYWQVLTAQEALLPASVRLLVVGGEAAAPAALARWRSRHPEMVWINAYGPTEASVTATTFELAPGQPLPAAVPIGRPLDNVQAYVLDRYGRLALPGAPGELVIGGAGVAAGYHQRPQLNAQRFAPDPYGRVAGGRLYRTGDLARWNWQGQLEFLGRSDHQVKLRGFRIELGEIEQALSTHPGVMEAVAECRPLAGGEPQLIAFVALAGQGAQAPSASELRTHLLRMLPAYMVPSLLLPLASFPRTAGGKPDRAALRRRDVALVQGSLDTPAFAPPLPGWETLLAGIWAGLLGRTAIGVDTDFFEAGGHSLLALQLVHKMSLALGRPVSVALLLRHRTIRGLVQALTDPAETSAVDSCMDRLQAGQQGVPLFILPGGDGNSLSFMALAHAMGPARPLYAFRTPGLDGSGQTYDRIETLAGHFSREILATGQSEVWLGGWSMGGVVALELARQLRQAGMAVAGLIVLDGFLADDLHGLPDVSLNLKSEIFAPNEVALMHYRPAFKLDVQLYYLLPEQEMPGLNRQQQLLRWQDLFALPLRQASVAGNHFTLLREPAVASLADMLSAILAGGGTGQGGDSRPFIVNEES